MNLFEFLLRYWPIILSVFGWLATWFAMQNVDKDHEKRITKLESDRDADRKSLQNIEVMTGKIETKLDMLINAQGQKERTFKDYLQ